MLMAITLAQAQAKLKLWMAADDAVASGQSYMVGGRMLTRAQSMEIRKNITFWNGQVDKLSRGGIKIIGANPV